MKLRIVLAALAIVLTAGCTGVPDGVEVVDDFELERYLGTWYEIARLDHSFERGLENVTANYSLRDDGGVAVLNRGYDVKKGEWDDANGKAYFNDDPTVGRLKVSFFGPFYAGYNVIELDKEDYSYALVSGPDRDYLWVLARDPNIDRATVDALVGKAKDLGYPTDELIWVDHSER